MFQVVSKTFFDKPGVMTRLQKAEREALTRLGAFVRQRAKTSIRKRKGTSKPGLPPFSHTGTLRRGILFSYDSAANSVVIGPVLLGSMDGAPEALEHGGRPRGGGKYVRKRPFMLPAFVAELPKFPGLIKDRMR